MSEPGGQEQKRAPDVRAGLMSKDRRWSWYLQEGGQSLQVKGKFVVLDEGLDLTSDWKLLHR